MEADYDRGGVLPYLDEAEGSVTTDVAVTVCRENGRWIMKITDPLIEAFMGNFGAGGILRGGECAYRGTGGRV